jgi:ATP-dependent 26S proteasome regulatory subunit
MAVEIPLPNKAGRYRLVELYARRLSLAPELVDEIVERTEGTTASFTKELMRRAVLVAAEREAPSGPEAVDVREALDELLSDRDTLTRRLLGGESDSDGDEQFISIEFNEDED